MWRPLLISGMTFCYLHSWSRGTWILDPGDLYLCWSQLCLTFDREMLDISGKWNSSGGPALCLHTENKMAGCLKCVDLVVYLLGWPCRMSLSIRLRMTLRMEMVQKLSLLTLQGYQLSGQKTVWFSSLCSGYFHILEKKKCTRRRLWNLNVHRVGLITGGVGDEKNEKLSHIRSWVQYFAMYYR